MNWIVSKGELKDASAIAQFQLDMAIESEGMQLDFDMVLKGVTAALQDENKGTYLITRDCEGEPVASLLLTREWSDWTCAWYWWIQSVFVKPEFRRKGVYSSLYAFVKRLAAENNVHSLRLYVDKNNEKGLKTYSSLGMHESHYLFFEEDI